MKTVYYLVLIAVLLASCSVAPSENKIQTAIAQTQTALPSPTIIPTSTTIPTPTEIPTPTAIPLKDINLSEIMFLSGDLPAGFEPSQIRSNGVGQDKWVGQGVINKFSQDLAYKGGGGGNVSVYIYNSSEHALNAYQQLTSSWTCPKDDPLCKIVNIAKLGDKALGQSYYLPLLYGLAPIEGASITFIHCNALVYATLNQYSAYNGLIDYAIRLDERLAKLVCQ
jgi:hypothetical protein